MNNTEITYKGLIYNTTLNVIGGLSDCSMIYKSINSYFCKEDSVKEMVTERNELNLRTDRSRIRVTRAINEGFVSFYGHEHEELIQEIFKNDKSLTDRNLILFWQFALSNRLFREISTQVFTKLYYSGKAMISKDDIIGYLKEFLLINKTLNLKWSESTINTLSTKYLNLMTKLNFLQGAKKKSFCHIKPSSEALVIFLYFVELYNSSIKDLFKSEILSLSFMASDDILERLKKLSLKGLFNMNYNGISLNIELIHSYKGICDVLYNR